MAEGGPIDVTVVYSPTTRDVRLFRVALMQGATVADALEACGLWREFPGIEVSALGIGIWGHRVAPSQRLAAGDRIEVCRPLKVDPKLARRKRFARQGARASGLFAKTRSGAKPGY